MTKEVQLQIGDSAPQIIARDCYGAPVNLANYRDKHVLLVFMRYSGCPFCNLAIHRLTLEYKLLAKNGCEVIAFMQSTEANVKKNIYDRHKIKPPYPIVADKNNKFYNLYGVNQSAVAAARSIKEIPFWLKSVFEYGFRQTELDGNMLLVPAMFLVSPGSQPGEQTIIKAEYGQSFYDHRTFTSIYEPLTFK